MCYPRRSVTPHSFLNKYRPQFYFRTSDVTGNAFLPQGVEMVMPGDNVSGGRGIDFHGHEKGQRFAIREGGHHRRAGQ